MESRQIPQLSILLWTRESALICPILAMRIPLLLGLECGLFHLLSARAASILAVVRRGAAKARIMKPSAPVTKYGVLSAHSLEVRCSITVINPPPSNRPIGIVPQAKNR